MHSEKLAFEVELQEEAHRLTNSLYVKSSLLTEMHFTDQKTFAQDRENG